LRSSFTYFALRTLWTYRTLRTCFTSFTLWANRALRACFTSFALWASRTYRALRTWSTNFTLRTNRTLWAFNHRYCIDYCLGYLVNLIGGIKIRKTIVNVFRRRNSRRRGMGEHQRKRTRDHGDDDSVVKND